MNKIFKVIWSKAKHCYIVASELAKSYSKGGGSRTLRRAAVAILAAAVYAASGSALAENNSGGQLDGDGNYIGESPNYKVTIVEDVSGSVYGRKEDGNTSEKANINISGGTIGSIDNYGEVYGGSIYGGFVDSQSGSGDAASNSITIIGDSTLIKASVWGGSVIQGSGDAASNSVNIIGGIIGTVNDAGEVRGGGVTGGYVFYGSGDVATNSVNISGGHVLGSVQGGNIVGESGNGNDNGNVFSNSVNISGSSTLIGGSVYGGSNGNTDIGAVYSNSIDISGGTIGSINDTGNVYGGYSGSNDVVASNSITISGALTSIKGSVYGGYSSSGKVASNSVTISGGTVGNNVYGGYVESGSGNVASNSVTISGGTIGSIDEFGDIIGGVVYGGYVEQGSGNATSNSVNISGGTINNSVFGGFTRKGNAASNSVNIKGGTVNRSVYGGFTAENGNAASNSVNISGGISYSVYGGYSNSGNANENQVTIVGGEIAYDSSGNVLNSGNLYGGFAGSKEAASNSVNISGGKINKEVYGGWSHSAAASNSVNISGGTINAVNGGYSFADKAYCNFVKISSGTINNSVYGGRSYKSNSASNSVNITGGQVGSIYGGYSGNLNNVSSGIVSSNSVYISGDLTVITSDVYGGYAENSNGLVLDNKVSISGGTVNNNVYGGYSDEGDAASNSVSISDGEVNNNVYGGYVEDDTGSASYNIVNISDVKIGSIDNYGNFRGGCVYGGYVNSGSGDATLNSVTINNGNIYNDVYGGNSYKGNAASNSVTISGASTLINGFVCGGFSFLGAAASNSVDISGGNVNQDVCGGFVHGGTGSASFNLVTISGGKVNDSVYGGRSYEGDAASNSVIISGGTIGSVDDYGDVYGGNIYGGYVDSETGSGDAASNSITISGASTLIKASVWGGSVIQGSGDAASNSVNIIGGTIGTVNDAGEVRGGGVTGGYIFYGSGDVASNSVNISGGTVRDSVYGGHIEGESESGNRSGNVISNSVNIGGGTVKGSIYGGSNGNTDTGVVASNSVTINDGAIEKNVYGGFSGSCEVASNSVTISGASTSIKGSVYGGISFSGNVASNAVTISGGTIGSINDTGNVYGGYSDSRDAASNSVNISGGTVNDSVFGGYVTQGIGSASYNLVNISDGTINQDVYGGYVKSGSGDAASNSINISSNSNYTARDVYGGYIKEGTGTVASNSVNISGNSTNTARDVYGGYIKEGTGTVASNSVNISGGTVTFVYGGYVESGSANVASNSVNISSGIVGNNVYGGYIKEGTGTVASNSVNISDGNVVFVYGGYVYNGSGNAASNSVNISDGNVVFVYGGYVYNGSGNAASNSVNISGGNVVQNVYGGYIKEGTGVVASNSVNISGGNVSGHVYGGYVYNGSGAAASNLVTINGGSGILDVYGGYSNSGAAASNSVNISGVSLNKVYGGYSNSGEAVSNLVNISGGNIGVAVYGGYSSEGAAASNTVNISSGEIGFVYGGYVNSGNGAAASNSVTISGGNIGVDVYGGNSVSGAAASNSVNISGGTIEQNVFGGRSYSGNAASNSVNISGDTTNILGNIYGGVASYTGNAYENKVNIATGTLKIVYGGYSKSGSVASNSVDISGVLTKINEVYGGYVNEDIYTGTGTGIGSASYNIVNISDSKAYVAYGGYANGSGDANDNQVTMTGGEIVYDDSITNSGRLYGGYSNSGSAANNSVKMSDAILSTEVYGGYVNSGSGDAASNSVNISGGSVGGSVGDINSSGAVYGGYVNNGSGNAASNSVIISGVAIGGRNERTGDVFSGEVYGGYVESGSGDAASNSVNISGASTKIICDVWGGFVYDGTGSASYNIVNINGGTFNRDVGGGKVLNDTGSAKCNIVNISDGIIDRSVHGGWACSGEAASNSVNISGGTIGENVYGGYSTAADAGAGLAASNSVSISGDSTTITGNVYGGWSYAGKAINNYVNISGGTISNVHGGSCGSLLEGSLSEGVVVASNSVNISGDTTLITDNVYGGYIENKEGSISDNIVNISGGTVNGNLFGGLNNCFGNAASNSVNISGGTVNKNVYGGDSVSGNATCNSVDISGDTTSILGNIYGGIATYTGNAYENKVNIATGSLKIVYGGYSESGSVASNSVAISGDTTKINEVYGGYVNSGTGSASYNIVNISDSKTYVAYGGYANGSGDANDNQVTMTGGKILYDNSINNSGNLYGGYVYNGNGNSASNSVSISGGNVGYEVSHIVYGGNVFGGYVNRLGTGDAINNRVDVSGATRVFGNIYGGVASGTGNANYNQVNITAGSLEYVFGGYSVSGNSASNTVNVSGGYVDEYVYGGYSESGNANSNSINISGALTDVYQVYGGRVNSGTGSVNDNKVTFSNGKVQANIYGGLSRDGNVTGNTVNMRGGELRQIFGGYSYGSGDSASNSVNISGGKISEGVYGGFCEFGGSIASNSINISGGTFGSGTYIETGFITHPDNSSFKDNSVNLSGNVTGLDNAKIYGYNAGNTSVTHSGNELHIGRAVDYDDEGDIKRDTDGNIIYKVDESTIWQGKNSNDSVNNKIKQVANFESIVLHEVAWNNSLPALAAESFSYNGETSFGVESKVTLDISNLAFDTELPSGVITLLQSDTENNFSYLKLKYSDSVPEDFIPDSGTTVKSDTNKTTQSKGVKLTYDFTQSVSLSDSNKKVNFTALNRFKKAELGSMKWSDGGYVFANTDAIDANGLVVDFSDNFKVEGAEDKNKDDSLVLLDLSTITSAETKDAIDTTKILTYDRNPTSAASMTLSLSQTDKIETNTDKNKITYTIGTKYVTKATFDKELVWNTSQPFYDASNSGYTFDENTLIDAQNLTLAFTDDQKDSLKEEDSMTLISAAGISSSNNVSQPDTKTFQLSRTGDLGTKFDGTATGVVRAENSAVKYQISKIETDKITLGSRSWTANAESLPDTWRVKADTVIDANDFSFTSNAVTALASGDTKTLVEGSGFADGSKIADKKVGIDYTVNSLKLGATALGQIETTTTAVQFKVNSVTLDGLDISGWKSTDDVSAVPDVWVANANGVDITATNFDPELTSGSKTIITATTAAFSDNKIDENIRYKADSFSNDSKNGVTFAGFQEGGVKTTDGGKALTYYAMFNDVTDISLGEMNWGTIRDASTVNYDYANISNGSIDISNLTFTAPENIDAVALTTLLTANNSLATGENISHSQDFEKAADNGAKFESTLSGSVIRTTAGEISYKATGTTLNGVDLSQWNSTKEASAVPDGWTTGGALSINTGDSLLDFDAEKTVLTSNTDGYFSGNSSFAGVNSYSDDSNNKHSFDSDTDKGVTLDGYQLKGFKASNDGRNLVYAVDDTRNVTSITLGKLTADDYRDMSGTKFSFSNLDSIDASKLELKLSNEQTGALSGSSVMTLVANAAGLADGKTATYGSTSNHSQTVSYLTENGLAFSGTMKGTVSTKSGEVNYLVNGLDLDSLELSGWDDTKDAYTLKDGWVANADGVKVTASTFSPSAKTGEKTIITASTNVFKDENIDESIRYGINSFENDSENGVTLSGDRTGGVKASDDGMNLKYYAMSKDVTSISLGNMKWGEGRTIDSDSIYDFGNVNKIDATALKFSLSNEQTESLTKGSSILLLSDASGLTADKTVSYKDNASSHSQSINYNTSNGIMLLGSLSGTVSTSAETVNYTVVGISLDEVSLDGWDIDKEAAALLEGWSTNTDGVKITATSFDPKVTTGEKTILTASNDVFKDENIDESIRYKKHDFFNDDSVNGVTLSGYKTGGVKASDDGMKLKYYAMSKNVTDISLGSMKWGEGRIIDSDSIFDFRNTNKIDATGLMFTNPEDVNGSMELVLGAKNLEAGKAVNGSSHSQKFDSMLDNKIVISAILTGEVSVEAEKVKYVADGISINKFDIANWDGEKASSVNSGWKLAENARVETDGMSILPGSDEEKQVFILKSDTEGYFANVAINGENAYGKKQNKFTDSDEAGSVVLDIAQEKGVALDNSKTNIIYKLGSKDVTNFKLNTIAWKDGAELLNRDKYNYSKLTSLDTDAFSITFEKPETITVNQTMTLLKANDTLTDIAAVEKSNAYSYSPVSGVTMDAIIMSRLEAKSGKVALTAFSNKADKLTFGDVEWLDKGALIDHKTLLNNVSFDGADVDTTKIAFTNKQKLDADMQMTLVSDFGDSVGTITGDKYKVGTAYEGEGSAYLDGSDLKFKIKTGAGLSDETHTTVMSMDAGIAVLTAGSEQIGTAIEGLGNAANIAPDGTATFAAVGGGSARYKTGSHVDTNSWNIALAVGKNLEKKNGTLEYGLFGEYGRGNYTLHMDGVEDAGSGNSRYTGGGLITKWTNSHNVYTEASFRLGNVKENTSNILHDGAGNGYGYDKKAKYKGGHIGFGKKYREDENTELEIYGKFFYNEREGINFAAGADQYSLDKVRSRILRAGFRLASTDRKWNRYGGIAYDHEFGGESTGSVNGMAIRSASIKGGTIRGEFGLRREATKTNPWKTDISLYGFTGKRNGFGGNIAVEYHF